MIALLLFLSLDAATAQVQLDRLKHELASRGKAGTMSALEEIAREAPGTEPAGRALLWLGDLARENGQRALAVSAYERALPTGGDIGRLAERGLGDVDMLETHYRAAHHHYLNASQGASPLLAAELEQKLALSTKLQWRRIAAFVCLAFVVAALCWFLVRVRRRGPSLEVPGELIYVLPVYALLVAGSQGKEPNIVHAIEWCALASLPLIVLSALAAMRSPTRTWLHASVLGLASVALFYVILWHEQLLDALIITAAP